MQFVALDDLDPPKCGPRDRPRQLRSLIAGIGEDAFDEGEQTTRAAIEHQSGAVAVLDIGGVDDDVQQEAERVDEDVPLAALDLLARVIA